jgi:hypothetical protein
MRLLSRAATGLAAVLALAATLATPALAQGSAYPNKPVRMVVTFPPGGSADAVVRMLVPRLRKAGPAGGGGQPPRCGRQHRPDGGGQGPPGDGYTLGVGAAGALAANSSLYAQMPFDPSRT